MKEQQHFEFSKIIVKRGTWLFTIQTILTLGVIFWRPQSAQYAVSLMTATMPLYVVIFGGYFGKAGIENYQKIKFWEQPKDEDCNTLNG
jgi:hypothetical protein